MRDRSYSRERRDRRDRSGRTKIYVFVKNEFLLIQEPKQRAQKTTRG